LGVFEPSHKVRACSGQQPVHAAAQRIPNVFEPARLKALRLVVLHNITIEVAFGVVNADPWTACMRQPVRVAALRTHTQHDHALLASWVRS